MERQFSGKSFRKLWATSRGSPLFPFGTGIREMLLPFARTLPFPGPFSQDRVNYAGWNAL